MARYILLEDLELDGLPFLRGDVVNMPSNLNTVGDNLADLEAIPRLRLADISLNPPYVPVPVDDQLGLPGGELSENRIVEPVLPTENSQYD